MKIINFVVKLNKSLEIPNMKLNLYSLLVMFLLITLASCNTVIKTIKLKEYPQLDNNHEIQVFEEGQKVPVNTVTVGRVKIIDSGFTVNCSYPVVIGQAVSEARKMGGDAIQIIDHKYPSIWGSTCHQILADVLKIEDTVVSVDSVGLTEDSVDNNSVLPQEQVSVETLKVKYKPLRLSFDLGWGYQLAAISKTGNSVVDSYYRRLKSGLDIGASASYFWHQQYGAGMYMHVFGSSPSMNIDEYTLLNLLGTSTAGSTSQYHSFSEDYRVLFVGPGFTLRNFTASKKGNMYSSVAFGYLSLHDDIWVNGVKAGEMYGSRVGLLAEVGYEHFLSETTALHISMSALSGVLSSYTIELGGDKTRVDIEDPKYYIGLGRLNITAGLSFNLGKSK